METYERCLPFGINQAEGMNTEAFHSAVTARALMQADLQQDLRVDSGKPLVFHQLIQVADNRWYWYQRYHHLLVDGCSFPATW